MPESARLVAVTSEKVDLARLERPTVVDLHEAPGIALQIATRERVARGVDPFRCQLCRISVFFIIDKQAPPGVGQHAPQPDEARRVEHQHIVVLHVHGKAVMGHERVFEVKLAALFEHLDGQPLASDLVEVFPQFRRGPADRLDQLRIGLGDNEIDELAPSPQIAPGDDGRRARPHRL